MSSPVWLSLPGGRAPVQAWAVCAVTATRLASGLALGGLLMVAAVARGQEPPRRLLVLRGVVTDTTLRPLSGVLVSLATARQFAVTDDDGRFTLADVEAAFDTLHVRGKGFAPRSFRMALADAPSDTVDVGVAVLRAGPPPALLLTVTVRDTLLQRPVAAAEVMVNDRVVGTTDSAGVLSARSVPVEWGINSVMVRRVGYRPLVGMLWIDEPDGRWVLDAAMQRPAVDLPAVVVEADRITLVFGRMRDFWLRREREMGRFITQDDIERRRPAVASDLLLGVPGLGVQRTAERTRVFSTRGQQCAPSVWIDGSPSPFGADVDRAARPGEIAGVEIYSDYATTPVQFSVPGVDRCGAIVIWTK